MQKCSGAVKVVVVVDRDSGEVGCYDRSYVALTTVAITQDYCDRHFTTLHIEDRAAVRVSKGFEQGTYRGIAISCNSAVVQ